MKDIMLDIETIGDTHDAAIVQIAACWFDRKTGIIGKELSGIIGKEFSVNVDMQSCFEVGLRPSASTIKWWLKQDKEAIDKVFTDFGDSIKISDALEQFSKFVSGVEAIWSHATFDFVIMNNAFQRCGIKIPYPYHVARDLRTLYDLSMKKRFEVYQPAFVGVEHNALDDCKHQVKITVEYIRRLMEKC